MDQYKQTPKPDYLFFKKFISYLGRCFPNQPSSHNCPSPK